MALRTIARWLALSASLVAAALPPAATRTVCAQTGRAAISWSAHAECALATVSDRPACCDGDHDPPAPPGDDEDCCRKSPARTPTVPPAADDDAPAAAATAPLASQPAVVVPATPPTILRAPSATGPPDHATRRHLRAHRVDVLTL